MIKVLISILFLMPISVFAVGMSSTTVRQGDVAFIDLSADCYKTSLIVPKLGTFPVFNFQKKKILTIPVDIYHATGTYSVPKCGTSSSTFTIISRVKETQEFVIPKEQGGNTAVNAIKVKKGIEDDARVLKVATNKKQLWFSPFTLPVKDAIVTDTYGYSRDSNGVNILHKGTDFKADIGTPVYAMNRGVVRYIGKLPTYGRTVIIDHGRGIQTVYLHLSKILVKEGSLINQGQMLGRAGNSGFVTGPHLHLSVRVLGISIDPESFMDKVGKK